jgi:hypothetical protein
MGGAPHPGLYWYPVDSNKCLYSATLGVSICFRGR